MIRQTPYGEVPTVKLQEFLEIAGYILREDGEYALVSEPVKYWQLVNPSATAENKRFQKKLGNLSIRDLNFQYALKRTKKLAHTPSGKEVLVNDVLKAMKYAKENLFDANNNPVYLPDELAIKQEIDPADRPYSYSKLLA